jgi:hypothetical protein
MRAAMQTERPISSDDEHRVLKFRPRTLSQPPGPRHDLNEPSARRTETQPANDLSRYEATGDEPDDFRHRMLANLAALAFTVALIGAGIWLAVSIADMRRTQDCVLMGRRDCAHLATPQG